MLTPEAKEMLNSSPENEIISLVIDQFIQNEELISGQTSFVIGNLKDEERAALMHLVSNEDDLVFEETSAKGINNQKALDLIMNRLKTVFVNELLDFLELPSSVNYIFNTDKDIKEKMEVLSDLIEKSLIKQIEAARIKMRNIKEIIKKSGVEINILIK